MARTPGLPDRRSVVILLVKLTAFAVGVCERVVEALKCTVAKRVLVLFA